MPPDRDLFQLLRDPCVRLNDALRRPDAEREVVEALQNLRRVLECSPAVLGDRLADYVFFPLTPVFRQPHRYPPAALELALRCLLPLLERGWAADDRSSLAAQLLVLLTFIANPTATTPTDARVSAGSSDEAVEQALNCLSALFRSLRASPKSRDGLLATANLPALGHAFSVMLDVAGNHQLHAARLAALDALASFCEHVATKGVCHSFLPGVVSSITRILSPRSGPQRPPYRVIVRALTLLTTIIYAVFVDDNVIPATPPDEATRRQLTAAFSVIFKLHEHARPEVRAALLEFCKTVLERCSATLWDMVPRFLEITVQLVQRDAVGEQEENAVEQIRCLLDMNDRLSHVLAAVFHAHLRALPSTMLINDEEKKIEAVEFAMTCVTLIPQLNLHSIATYNMVQSSIQASFANLLSSESSSKSSTPRFSTLEDTTYDNRRHVSNPSNVQESFPIVLVKTSQSKVVLTKLQQLVAAIYGQDSLSIDVLALLQQAQFGEHEQRLGALWTCFLLARYRLDRELEMRELLSIPTSSRKDLELREELFAIAVDLLRDRGASSDNENADVKLLFLALEIIAMRAAELGNDFRPELVDVLYPVVRLMGSDLLALCTHAQITLDALARWCGYAHARELIVSNADYITNAVAAQLSIFDLSPEGPRTIRMLVQLCGVQLIGLLDDVIENIFESIDHFHGYPALVELLFGTLKSVVDEGVSSGVLNTRQNLKPSLRPISFGALATEIQRKRSKGRATEQQTAPQDHSGEGALGRETDKTLHPASAPVADSEPGGNSRLYQTLLRITRLTQHHLPNSSPTVRALLLSLLIKALPFLASDKDSLLPLIHTLWPALVPRLDDEEAYVVAAVLDVIAVACEHAGDFMSARIEALWPSIRKLLLASSDHSAHSHTNWQSNGSLETGKKLALLPRDHDQILRKRAPQEHALPSAAAPVLLRITDLSLRDPVNFTAQEPPPPPPYVPTTAIIVQKALDAFLVALLGHVHISPRIVHEIITHFVLAMETSGWSCSLKYALESRNSPAMWFTLASAHGRRVEYDKVSEGPYSLPSSVLHEPRPVEKGMRFKS